MQGSSTAVVAALAVVLGVATGLAHPTDALAEDFGPFDCVVPPHQAAAAMAEHEARFEYVRRAMVDEAVRYRAAREEFRAAERRGVPLTSPQGQALTARVAVATTAYEATRAVFHAWDRCRDELRYRRRFLARQQHHVRLSLGFDGSLSSMANRDYDGSEDDYQRVWYRTPGVSLQVGWERYFSRRLGMQVNVTVAAGQGRFRACRTQDGVGCYGTPAAGGALSVGVDVGINIWLGSVVVLTVSAELRVAWLPVTERVQSGYRYSVSDRVVPAALLRLAPEIVIVPSGRMWVSPSFGFGRMLTQQGPVFAFALRLGVWL